jgi:hypothetical protein
MKKQSQHGTKYLQTLTNGSRKSFNMTITQELPNQIQTKEKEIKEAFFSKTI